MQESEEVFSLERWNISWKSTEVIAPSTGGNVVVAAVDFKASKNAFISGDSS